MSPAVASSPTIPYQGELAVIQANSLIAVSSPYLVNTVILGDLTDNPYKEKYPEIIEKLNCCENFCKWDNNKIIDVNNRYSYGGLMFQLETFIKFGKLYEILPKNITPDIAEQIIYKKDLQIRIAEEMIDNGLGGTSIGWQNCWLKMNLNRYLY